jgi:hypothetical protein
MSLPKALVAFVRSCRWHFGPTTAGVLLATSLGVLPLQAVSAVGQEVAGPGVAEQPPVCDLAAALGTPGARVLPVEQPPTRISIMPTRYWDLTYTLVGTEQTGVSLVALNGKILGPSGGLDDVGSYYLIPELSRLFRLPMSHAVDLFYDVLLFVGFLTGAIGFCVLYATSLARSVAVVGLLALTGLAYHVGDVYVLSFLTAVVTTPWLLALVHRPDGRWLPLFLAALGMLVGIANAVRSYAGTAALLFSCLLLLFQVHTRASRKLLLFLCLAGGMIVPKLFFAREVARRDAFLSAHCPTYGSLSAMHPVWHSVFIGFGYLQNNYGITWSDVNAHDRVQSIAPGTTFGSVRYERILRDEVIQLLRRHPWFVFETMASKLGVVLVLVALSVNFGALAAIYVPKPWAVELSFGAAIVFSSFFALLTIPALPYMLGLISFAVLYGIVSVGFYLESRSNQHLDPARGR